MPENYSLSQNYPNPFNASTTIHFALPKQTQISLTIFDLLGKEIRIIVEGRFAAGQYEIELNAADLTSGLYFYRLAAENFNMVRKLVILR